MGRFFAPGFGYLEITPFYADNEIYCQEVRFSVPADQWSEFEMSQTYQQLVDYVHSLQNLDIHTEPTALGRTAESAGFAHNPNHQAYREPFWVRVRKAFYRMRHRL